MKKVIFAGLFVLVMSVYSYSDQIFFDNTEQIITFNVLSNEKKQILEYYFVSDILKSIGRPDYKQYLEIAESMDKEKSLFHIYNLSKYSEYLFRNMIEKGNTKQAIIEIEKFINIYGYNFEVKYQLALLKQKQGEFESSIILMDELKKSYRKYNLEFYLADTYYNNSLSYFVLHNFEKSLSEALECLKIYQKLKLINKINKDYYKILNEDYSQFIKKNRNKASDILEEYLSINIDLRSSQ